MRAVWRWTGVAIALIVIGLCWLGISVWKEFRPYHWQVVESPDAHFRISFPGSFKASQETNTAVDGSAFLSNRLTSSPAQGVIYAVSWWENPAQESKSTEELFANFRGCDIKTFHGTVISEKVTDVQGYPAMDVALAGNGFVVRNRMIRVGPRLYSQVVMGPLGRLHGGDVQKFFDSFTLRQM